MANADGKVRRVQARGWATLGVAGVAMGAAWAGPSDAGFAKAGTGWQAPAQVWRVSDSAEGGEGGESGIPMAEASETVELLVRLGKIEAHLLTARDLAAAGQGGDVLAHIEAGEDEIYPSIKNALLARGASDFGGALEALADVAKSEGDMAETMNAAMAGVEAARAALAPSAKDELAAVLALAREAAEDFTVGVVDGAVVELREYQDARGYVLAAQGVAARLEGASDPVVVGAATASAAALGEAVAALSDVAPANGVGADPSLISSVAARIELAAYQVK